MPFAVGAMSSSGVKGSRWITTGLVFTGFVEVMGRGDSAVEGAGVKGCDSGKR